MKIYTHAPILKNPEKINLKIAAFWDKLSCSWQKIWGVHIHHGYYENGLDNPQLAQERLVEKLVKQLNLAPQSSLLDLGCGLGGSSQILAQKYQAHVTGISLSQTQIALAECRAKETGMQAHFLVEDAHTLSSFSDNSFDLIWSLESCEQFYDKEKCIQQAVRVLKPGGKLMIATWCADQEYYMGSQAKRYISLCRNFDLPYMPSIKEYTRILDKYLKRLQVEDWSNQVVRSWEDGISTLKKHSWLSLLRDTGLRGLRFAAGLKTMRDAFKSGQLRYGVFVYQKD